MRNPFIFRGQLYALEKRLLAFVGPHSAHWQQDVIQASEIKPFNMNSNQPNHETGLLFSLAKGNKTDQREEGHNCPGFSNPGYCGSSLDSTPNKAQTGSCREYFHLCRQQQSNSMPGQITRKASEDISSALYLQNVF